MQTGTGVDIATWWCGIMVIEGTDLIDEILACVASFSIWFRAKKRPWKGICGFDHARNEKRTKKWKRGRGRGRKEMLAWLGYGKNIDMCRWKVCFILRDHVWYMTPILISCGCCLFWLARFTLQGKSIFLTSFERESSFCDYMRVSGCLIYSLKCLLDRNN